MKKVMPSLYLISTLLLNACADGGNSVSDQINTADGTKDTPSLDSNPIIETSYLATGSIMSPATVYYDLETFSKLDLTDDEATANDDWDIAFRRTDVYLNNMASTPVTLYFLDNLGEFYDADGNINIEKFTNSTPTTELNAFANLATDISTEANFNTDEVRNTISDFYQYDPVVHITSANSEVYFIVSSDNALTKFHVTELVQDGFGLSSITFNTFYQADGKSLFSDSTSLTVDARGCTDNLYIDFDNLKVTTADDAWDIHLPCGDGLAEYEINLADDARALSGDYSELVGIDDQSISFYDWSENKTKVLAIDAFGDQRSSYGWGEYGINGSNVIWPNFAAYIIQTETARYKFQITSYYDPDTGVSGSFSVRHQLITKP